MRQIQYRWLGKNWTLNIHPPGDCVCDMFHAPQSMEILPWLMADLNGTFLDIGAHVGTTAIHAAPFFPKVLAFEPEPRNLECLLKNISHNHLPNVTVIRKAVSDSCGKATFYVNDTVDTGRNSLAARPNSRSFEVDITTIDQVFSSDLPGLPPITFIKIDVEGFEPKVLHGAEATIARQSVKPVMKLEFTPSSWSTHEPETYWLFDYLEKNDYLPLFPTCGFPSPITVSTLKQIYESWKHLPYDSWVDILLVPRDRATPEHIIGSNAKVARILGNLA